MAEAVDDYIKESSVTDPLAHQELRRTLDDDVHTLDLRLPAAHLKLSVMIDGLFHGLRVNCPKGSKENHAS